MSGVRQKGERVRQPSTDGLDDENEGRERQGPRQGSRRAGVIVAMRMRVRSQTMGVRVAVSVRVSSVESCAIREKLLGKRPTVIRTRLDGASHYP